LATSSSGGGQQKARHAKKKLGVSARGGSGAESFVKDQTSVNIPLDRTPPRSC